MWRSLIVLFSVVSIPLFGASFQTKDKTIDIISIAQEIGRAYRNGSGDMSWLTHKVCHFVLGGGSAALKGEDPVAGAIGATIGEVVADAMIARALEQTRAGVLEQLEDFRDTYGTLPPVQDAEALIRLTYLEHLEAEQADQIQRIGRLAAAGTAFVGRMDISAADAAADLAIEYNSIGSQIENLRNWIGDHYRIAQVWLDEHEFISIFVPGSLWAELEGKVHRDEKLTTSDFIAAGLSFLPVSGNALGKGVKALAFKAGKKTQKTVVVGGCKKTWNQLNKAERMVYQRNFIEKLKQAGRWQDSGHKIGGVKAFYDKEEKVYYTVVKGEKCDIEVWRKISGKKVRHEGAKECVDGTLYEIGRKDRIVKFD